MAFNTGGHIIRDNLVAFFDANNTKSYPGSGAVWNDLVNPNHKFINYNGAGISGSQPTQRLVFDGSDDIAQYVGTPSGLQGDPDFTVFGAFYRTGDMDSESCWGFGTGTTLDGFNTYNGGTPNDIAMDLWGDSTVATGTDYPLNEWVLVHWVKTAGALNTTNITFWINDNPETGGDLVQVRGGTNTPTIGTEGMILGRAGYSVNAYFAPVDIGFIAFYDRVLTTDEILLNFNAKRTRYGI